jgi:hypothetical protein
VVATDSSGNVAQSAPISFTTLGAADVTEPTTTPSLGSGTYSGEQNLSLSADKPANIYYTTDGSTPTPASAQYNGPIKVAASKKISFFAIDGSGNQEVAKSVSLAIQFPITTATPDSNGSLSCPALVTSGETAVCTATPNTGYTAAVSGCGAGNLSGSSYTTGAINGACTVTANFTLISYAVTPTAGIGSSVLPATPQNTGYGSSTSFTVAPLPGYGILDVTGCNGTLNGSSYTTGTITGACTVSVTAVKHSGSADGSAVPTITDALKALQGAYNLAPLTAAEKILYDVAPLSAGGTPQGDGSVGVADVILILRRSIGIGSW